MFGLGMYTPYQLHSQINIMLEVIAGSRFLFETNVEPIVGCILRTVGIYIGSRTECRNALYSRFVLYVQSRLYKCNHYVAEINGVNCVCHVDYIITNESAMKMVDHQIINQAGPFKTA